MSDEPIDVIRRSHAALNAHDARAVAMLATPDVEVLGPTGEMRGRDALQILAQTFMSSFPDNEWIATHQVAAGDTVATEYLLEGTHSGELRTPLGALLPTGKRVALRASNVSRVRDGLIMSSHVYWDNLAFMSALGIVPIRTPIPRASAVTGRRFELRTDADSSAAESLAHRLQEALNAHDLDAILRLASPDIEVVAPTVESQGPDALRVLVALYLEAFPDLRWHVMHEIASGDTVVTEQLVEGTHGGRFASTQGELEPTGNRGLTRVCQVLRVRHDVLESVHLYWDHLVLLQTVGAFS